MIAALIDQFDLMIKMENHARKLGCEVISDHIKKLNLRLLQELISKNLVAGMNCMKNLY
mgnify:CR=1 FL=1